MFKKYWKKITVPKTPYEDFVDIGHDIQIRIVYDENKQPCFLSHYCKDQNGEDHIASFNISYENTNDEDVWKIDQLYPLTISPSIWIKEIGCHGFIRNGTWVPVYDRKYTSIWETSRGKHWYRDRSGQPS